MDDESVETPQPGTHQLLVQVEAAPLNPSDLGLLLAMSDVDNAIGQGSGNDPKVTAPISPKVMPALKARVGTSMPVGNGAPGSWSLPATPPRRRPWWAGASPSSAKARRRARARHGSDQPAAARGRLRP